MKNLIIGILAIISFGLYLTKEDVKEEVKKLETELDSCRKERFVVYEDLTDWQMMKIALAVVESELCPDVVNNIGATGIYQIMPVYVAQCNKLSGYEKYTIADAKNVKKSSEMFELINSWNNKERSIEKAIKKHNPTSGKWYDNRVLDKFEIIKSIVEI